MSFLRWLLGSPRGAAAGGEYRDDETGFCLAIPAGWRHVRLTREFRGVGGRIALALPEDAGTFNVSCGAPDADVPADKHARADRACAFLARSAPRTTAPPVRDVATSISGESNVARAEAATARGFFGMISILHREVEYAIQYAGTERSRPQIEAMIASFALPGATTQRPAADVDYASLVGQLDARGDSQRRDARDNLVRAGGEAVAAILGSVHACNQAIMSAGSVSGPAAMGKQIDALRRRIEVLAAIGDPRGIPAMLNAIGDAAQCQDVSAEARRLLMAAQDAVVAVGAAAVAPIADVVDTPSPEIRLALVQVLGRIGGPQAGRVLGALRDDPDERVRVAARQAGSSFTFDVESDRPTPP